MSILSLARRHALALSSAPLLLHLAPVAVGPHEDVGLRRDPILQRRGAPPATEILKALDA